MQDNRKPLALSNREDQLIRFAADGLTDAAIAHRLGISEATVGTYWGRVRVKIGPYNRTELVSIYLRAQQKEALEDLKQQNANLIAELQNAAQSTVQPDTFYQELIENAPDAIILVSETGTVGTANRAAHELFAYGAGEMEGLPLVVLIPERLREAHQVHRAHYVSDPRRRSMGEHLRTPALRKGGQEILVRASLSALQTPSGMIVTCVLRQDDPE